MKNILITGGTGNIGSDLVDKIANLNYNVTILDLESKLSIKKMSKYKNKVKVIYGDVEDKDLMIDLVKKNDIVISLAGIMPPIANLNDDIANKTNFGGIENIVNAINDCNSECTLIYASFISVYGNTLNKTRILTVDSDFNFNDDLYSKSIIRSESFIKEKLTKYCILRMPIVLTKNNYYIKHLKYSRKVDFITVDDLNNIIISLLKKKYMNKKIYNISGFKMNSTDFIKKYYINTGKINIINRKLYYGTYDDADEINAIYKSKYIDANSYFKDQKNNLNVMLRYFLLILNFPKYLIFTYQIHKNK